MGHYDDLREQDRQEDRRKEDLEFASHLPKLSISDKKFLIGVMKDIKTFKQLKKLGYIH